MLNQIVGGVVVGLATVTIGGVAFAAWQVGRLASVMAATAEEARQSDKEAKEAKAKKEEKKDA